MLAGNGMGGAGETWPRQFLFFESELKMPVIHASGTLRKYLEARARGAPAAELKVLQLADETAREAEAIAKAAANVIDLNLFRKQPFTAYHAPKPLAPITL